MWICRYYEKHGDKMRFILKENNAYERRIIYSEQKRSVINVWDQGHSWDYTGMCNSPRNDLGLLSSVDRFSSKRAWFLAARTNSPTVGLVVLARKNCCNNALVSLRYVVLTEIFNLKVANDKCKAESIFYILLHTLFIRPKSRRNMGKLCQMK